MKDGLDSTNLPEAAVESEKMNAKRLIIEILRWMSLPLIFLVFIILSWFYVTTLLQRFSLGWVGELIGAYGIPYGAILVPSGFAPRYNDVVAIVITTLIFAAFLIAGIILAGVMIYAKIITFQASIDLLCCVLVCISAIKHYPEVIEYLERD